jgi:hypothetical protein
MATYVEDLSAGEALDTPAVHACRGHFGGMVGGALTAYLLGPRLRKNTERGLSDDPPVPIFARRI